MRRDADGLSHTPARFTHTRQPGRAKRLRHRQLSLPTHSTNMISAPARPLSTRLKAPSPVVPASAHLDRRAVAPLGVLIQTRRQLRAGAMGRDPKLKA